MQTMLLVFLQQRYSGSWPGAEPFTRPFFRKEGSPSAAVGVPSSTAHLGALLGSLVVLPTFEEVVPCSRFRGSLALNFTQYLMKKAGGRHSSQRPVVHACIATD